MVLRKILELTHTPFSVGKRPIFHLLLLGFFSWYILFKISLIKEPMKPTGVLPKTLKHRRVHGAAEPQNYNQSNNAQGTILFPHPTSATNLSLSLLYRVHCPAWNKFYILLKIKAIYQPYTSKSLNLQ